MSIPILAGVAWPYANALLHVGNLAGAYLPADIFARYQRMRGRRMLMVSGSDAHGTPILVRALDEGSTPEEVYQHYHERFLELWKKIGITFDLYTSTHTENHRKVSQAIFQALYDNGYLFAQKEQQWYSPSFGFLPDRFVEGTCYICGYPGARGDQCDKCGNLLDATKLINPRSRIDGSVPELRETEHLYFDLPKLQKDLEAWLETKKDAWRPLVVHQSLGVLRSEGLKPRPITRDLTWGIPVPVPGWEHKVMYVWFEAVIGYLSATIEWAQRYADPQAWHEWWYNPEARLYYFIGKDNIPFHALMWPAQTMAAGTRFGELFEGQAPRPLNLPYDVPANAFLNLEGQKISGSRNWAVWCLDFLSRYDPDPLRYYLTIIMPESRDTDWDWEDFLRRNNDELVATWGNLVHRVLSFTYKHWEGRVPEPGELSPEDRELLAQIDQGFTTVGEHLERVQLRAGLVEAMRLAGEVNRYLERRAPWSLVKEGKKEDAGTVMFTAIQAINRLKILLAPYLPFTSEALHHLLGFTQPLFGPLVTEEVEDEWGKRSILHYEADKGTARWEPQDVPPGQALQRPKPLVRKLEPSIVEEERARLGQPPQLGN